MRLISFTATLVFSAASLALPYVSEKQSYGYNSHVDPELYQTSYIRGAVPIKDEMTFARLKEVIESKKLTTIESVIGELPDNMKNENFVLMTRSRSLQDATERSPRVITYTPSARFALTFNGGDSKHAGSNTLEMVQFNDQTQSFEFFEAVFDGHGLPKFSAPNPAKCLECHQSPTRQNVDPRPNWEPYSVWPGAIGADGGHFLGSPLIKQYDFRNKKMQPQDLPFLEEQAREKETLATFIKDIAPSHPRYSQLGAVNIHASTDLTEHFAVLNAKRVVRLMKEQTEIFAAYQSYLDFGIRCGFDGYVLNNKYMDWHRAQPMQKYYNYGPEASVSNMITWVFEPLGVDTSDWSMDFQTRGRFAFVERFGTPSSPNQIFQFAWSKVQGAAPATRTFCDDIKVEIDAKLSRFFAEGKQLQLQKQAAEKARPVDAPQILNRCARCHSDMTGFAPMISFDSPKLLSKELSEPGFKRGTLLDEIEYRTSDMATNHERMPRGRPLSSDERALLVDYLKALGSGQK